MAERIPLLITKEVLEKVYREQSKGWEVYSAIYKKIDRIFKQTPPIQLMGKDVPDLALEQLLKQLRDWFLFDHDALTEERVKLLVTIWSYKESRVISSEYFSTSTEFGLMLAILEDHGTFEEVVSGYH